MSVVLGDYDRNNWLSALCFQRWFPSSHLSALLPLVKSTIHLALQSISNFHRQICGLSGLGKKSLGRITTRNYRQQNQLISESRIFHFFHDQHAQHSCIAEQPTQMARSSSNVLTSSQRSRITIQIPSHA
jgi:hypothetical protein